MKYNKFLKEIKFYSLIAISAISVASVCAFSFNTNSNKSNNNVVSSLDNKNIKNDNGQIVTSVNNIVIDDIGLMGNSSNSSNVAYATVKNNDVTEVYAWGQNDLGQLGVGDLKNRDQPTKIKLDFPADVKINFIQLGISSFVVYTVNGIQSIYVWGNNSDGQLGLDTTTPFYHTPTKLNFDPLLLGIITSFIIQNSATASSSMIIRQTGKKPDIYTWGNNESGQLGLGQQIGLTNFDDQRKPVRVAFFDSVFNINIAKVVFSGDSINHTAQMIAGPEQNVQPYVWGQNNKGQLGLGDNDNRSVPTLIPQSAFNRQLLIDIFIVKGNGWARTAGSGGFNLFLWGDNTYGQLGTNNNIDSNVPVILELPSNQKFYTLHPNSDSTSVIVTIEENDKKYLYAWGNNNFGQLGVDSSAKQLLRPTLISPTFYNNGAFGIVSSQNEGYNLTTRENGGRFLYSWGRNDVGQLGTGDNINKSRPVRINIDLSDAVWETFPRYNASNTITFYTEDVNDIKTFYVTGANASGELGLGNTKNINSFSKSLVLKYSNPVAKQFQTSVAPSDAIKAFNVDGSINRIELEKYVDLSSLPLNAKLTLNTDKTTIDEKIGSMSLTFTSDKIYNGLFSNVADQEQEFSISLTGFWYLNVPLVIGLSVAGGVIVLFLLMLAIIAIVKHYKNEYYMENVYWTNKD